MMDVDVDLTQMDANALRKLYTKLKQVSDVGLAMKAGEAPDPRKSQVYENLKEKELGARSPSHSEALRLFTEACHLTPRLIALQMSTLAGDVKKALELLLDIVWMTDAQPIPGFSFVTLMKEYFLTLGDVEKVKTELVERSDVSVRRLLKISRASKVEIIVTVLFAETRSSPLYSDILSQKDELEAGSKEKCPVSLEEASRECEQAKEELEETLKDTHTDLEKRLDRLQEGADEVNATFDELEKTFLLLKEESDEADRSLKAKRLQMMESNVVSVNDDTSPIKTLVPKRHWEEEEEVKVVEVRSVPQLVRGLPLQEDLPPLGVGENVLAKLTDEEPNKDLWAPAVIEEVPGDGPSPRYKVRFVESGSCLFLPLAMLAYAEEPKWRLDEGCRVVCWYRDEVHTDFDGWYGGTVGEKPTPANGLRYLVFFDDGAVQYSNTDCIRLVCWNRRPLRVSFQDVNRPALREFLKIFLTKLPYRQMARQPQIKSRIAVEREGTWYIGAGGRYASVVQKDASLIKVRFQQPGVPPLEEWIYRGSPRLLAISSLSAPASALPRPQAPPTMRLRRQPTQLRQVEYEGPGFRHRRQTARKSTAGRVWDSIQGRYVDGPTPSDTESSSDSEDSESEEGDGQVLAPRREEVRAERKEIHGRMVDVTLPKRDPPFIRPHPCSRACAAENPRKYKGSSPFILPLLFGWQRQVCDYISKPQTTRKPKKRVFYVTPCGRRLRNAEEVLKWLELTNSSLSVDNFAFDHNFKPCRRFEFHKGKLYQEDFSGGVEHIPIPVVNIYESTPPLAIAYRAQRFMHVSAKPGLIEKAFCSGCSCTGNCSDKSDCACRQLTREEVESLPRDVRPNHSWWSGYREDKRLTPCIQSGIYECNDLCICMAKKRQCTNRVVQYDLAIPLQLFQTRDKGWGVRTLVDIPAGQFICVYVGAILSDSSAEELGKQYGDEYFADMDLITVVESQKEGYESDFEDDESVIVESSNEPERKRSRNSNVTDSKERFFVHKYFKKDFPYLIDAKKSGNIGRYLNHGCDPNVFVQNVLVDTHDLRFPWVSFFARKRIEAGDELVWDYNYTPGSVPGKEIACKCGSRLCRGRLL